MTKSQNEKLEAKLRAAQNMLDSLAQDVRLAVVGSPEPALTALPLREARKVFEREYLLAQVNRFDGNVSRAAAFVGMERSAMHRKMKHLGITTIPLGA
jgi:DNA-binding NtrC family response regulator